MTNNSYFVGTLSNPENLNQYEYNGDLQHVMTMKYTIEGFERIVFVVEVEIEDNIQFLYLENTEEHYSNVIKNKDMIDLCNFIMEEYFKNNFKYN